MSLPGPHLEHLTALANAIPSVDPATGRHLHRATCLTALLCDLRGLQVDDPEREVLGLAARLQGLGKLLIPDAILDRQGPLSDADWVVLRRHPEYAVAIIRQVPAFAPAAGLVLARYERWDGAGYPRGLAGYAIPWGARVLAVAGSMDAMSAPRAHRAARDPHAVMEQLASGRGTQFDPRLVDLVLAHRDTVAAVLREGCPHARNAAAA